MVWWLSPADVYSLLIVCVLKNFGIYFSLLVWLWFCLVYKNSDQAIYFLWDYSYFYCFSSVWHSGPDFMVVCCWSVATVSIVEINPSPGFSQMHTVGGLFKRNRKVPRKSSLYPQVFPWGQERLGCFIHRYQPMANNSVNLSIYVTFFAHSPPKAAQHWGRKKKHLKLLLATSCWGGLVTQDHSNTAQVLLAETMSIDWSCLSFLKLGLFHSLHW